jgi:hypothetical protein
LKLTLLTLSNNYKANHQLVLPVTGLAEIREILDKLIKQTQEQAK